MDVSLRQTPGAARIVAGEQARAEADFLRRWPEYVVTRYLDRLRSTDYARLDQGGHAYLDYTGGGLYATSQLEGHHRFLAQQVLGNPHSENPTSLAMTEHVERVRTRVLRFFNASADDYTVIFTANATGALKLVGESFPFEAGSKLLLTSDNHNSVNGIREFALARGASVAYTPLRLPDLRLDGQRLFDALQARSPKPNLFAFPAQSNFSGVQHSLEWVRLAQSCGWVVLLDAAAFTPTNPLDLSAVRPDFVAQSFYKLFGYPTGIGCLLARKATLQRMRRPWYAGGTIAFSSVHALGHYLLPHEPGFEDGTVNYLGLPAVELGLDHLERIGLDLIHTRASCLVAWLLEELQRLKHANGARLVRVYGPTSMQQRGASFALNFYDSRGTLIDCYESQRAANALKVSVRAGCHCNPGAREASFGFTEQDMAECFRDKDRLSFDEFRAVISGKTTGALRVSTGLASNFDDVWRFYDFARSFLDRPTKSPA